ncbi:MAG: hypothetical protein DRJ47_06820 [Thermoprotei archaeon]|nr:MAG: hypothetical protein DRJ47_06820 [Thermoprotei archaeon]
MMVEDKKEGKDGKKSPVEARINQEKLSEETLKKSKRLSETSRLVASTPEGGEEESLYHGYTIVYEVEHLEVLSVRVPKEVRKGLEELAKLEGRDKAEIVREILIKGVKEKRVETALRLYREGKVTLWKAAELAGLSLWEMIEELEKRGVELQYGLEELEEDLRAALGEGGS